MANRNYEFARSLGADRIIVAGSFAPNGSSAVSATSNKGPRGWSVARTSTGLFTVTMTDVFSDIESVTATLQLATAADQSVLVGTISASASTFILTVWDASDAAVKDIAANANNRINFIAVCRLTAVTP